MFADHLGRQQSHELALLPVDPAHDPFGVDLDVTDGRGVEQVFDDRLVGKQLPGGLLSPRFPQAINDQRDRKAQHPHHWLQKRYMLELMKDAH